MSDDDMQFLARRRLRWQAEKAAAQAEEEKEVARRQHRENERMNAYTLREFGAKGYVCGPLCEECHPPALLNTTTSGLVLVDLTNRKKTKRGHCKICGKKCKTTRRLYCSEECRQEGRHRQAIRYCGECQGPLPESSRRDRQYCSAKCSMAAYRKRKRDTART